MNKNVLNSRGLSKLKKRRRRAFLNKSLIYILALSAAASLAAYLSRLPGINIGRVEAQGNSIIDSESIREVVESETAGKYLWLFPKTNILLYPKSSIRRALATAYPRLKDIGLSVKNDRLLLVSVTEREPLYTWCGASAPAAKTDENEKCYFLDSEGYIFDEAPYFSGNVYLRFYGASGIVPLYPKNSYFAREYFGGLVVFKAAAAALGLAPVAVYLKDDGDVEIYLSGRNTAKILLRADADMQTMTENLDVALDTEPLKTRFEKERSKLEYLDLRFENKVYSKFLPASGGQQ